MLSGIAYQAEIESENRAQRAKAWDDDRTANGGTPGGKTPYGFVRSNRGQLIIKEDEATLIRTAVTNVLSGVSLRKTHRDLSSKLYTTMTRNDETVRIPMTVRGLRHVIQSPTTAGFRRTDDGSLIKGSWNGIISEDQFIKIQVLFSDPDRRTGTTNQVQHLLSGIIECGKCGKNVGIRKWKMNPRPNQPYVQEGYRYVCQCNNSIDAEATEGIVMDRLWETVTPEVWNQWMTTGMGWDQSVIDGIRSNRERIMMLSIEGKISGEFADEQLAKLDHDEAIATGEEPLDLPRVDDIQTSWEVIGIKEQRKVIKHAFDHIKLNPSNGTRNPLKRLEVK